MPDPNLTLTAIVDDNTLAAQDQTVSPVVIGQTRSFTVTASGGDGTTVIFGKATEAQYGEVTVNSDGSATYTPGDYFPGFDSFTFTATDNTTSGSTAMVSFSGDSPPDSPPSPPKDPGTGEPPNEKKCKCPGMAEYSFDEFSASLQLQDEPLPYTSPFGPDTVVRFCYDSADESDSGAGGGHTNLGPRWKLNWVQFIEDHPGQNSSVKLNMGRGGEAVMPATEGSNQQTFARPERSRDTITTDGTTGYIHTLADGSWEAYSFGCTRTDGSRRLFLTAITDPHGNTATLTWQAFGDGAKLTAIRDAALKVTTFQYDDWAHPLRLTKVTDPFGRVCTIEYNGNGEVQRFTDPVGITSDFTYRSEGGTIVSTLTTPYGPTTFGIENYYEATVQTGRSVMAIDPEGRTERLSHVRAGDGVSYAYLSSHWTKQAFAAGMTPANARVTQWLQNGPTGSAVPIPASVKAPLTNPVFYTYPDQLDSRYAGSGSEPSWVSQLDADGMTMLNTSFTYTEKGTIATVTDPVGRTTIYDYDPMDPTLRDVARIRHLAPGQGGLGDVLAVFEDYIHGKSTTIIGADGRPTYLTYNDHGQLVTVTNAIGQITYFTYYDAPGTPAYGQRNTVTVGMGTALAATTTFAYDAARLISVTDHEGDTVSFTYDAIGNDNDEFKARKTLNRVTGTTHPDGTVETVVWDRLDVGEHRVTRPGAEDRWTTYVHDGNRKVTSATSHPSNKTVSYVQGNCCGSVDTLVDAAGNRTHWEYDILGRETEKWLRHGQPDAVPVQTHHYDDVGRLDWVQDARGNRKTLLYDNKGQLNTIQYTVNANTQETPAVSFTYEPAYGRLESVTETAPSGVVGMTAYTYHPISGTPGSGAVATESRVVPGGSGNYTHSYTYDALGRRTGGPRLGSANWDALGRLTQVNNGLGAFTYDYDDINGKRSGRLRQADTLLTGATASLRTSFTYGNAADGRQLTGILHQAGPDTENLQVRSQHYYGYDAQGRLATWQQWVGNVQRMWNLAQDADDQLTGVNEDGNDAFAYSYDDAGNRIASTAAGVTREWTANGLNQLTAETNGAAFTYDLDGNLLSDGNRDYAWDAENRLVAVNYAGKRVEWSYDAFNRRVQQRDTDETNGLRTRDLIWEGLSLIESRDQTTGEVRRYYGNGEERMPNPATPADPASVLRLSYTTDHLGSVRELVDGDGNIRARYDYDPYGNRTKQPVGDLDADFGFTGHYTHEASGLILAPYRGYDPAIGRWLSRDPIQEEGGINLYGYVGNGPLDRIDTLGLFDVDPDFRKNYPKCAARIDTIRPRLNNKKHEALRKWSNAGNIPSLAFSGFVRAMFSANQGLKVTAKPMESSGHYNAEKLQIEIDTKDLERCEAGMLSNGDEWLDAVVEHEFLHHLEQVAHGGENSVKQPWNHPSGLRSYHTGTEYEVEVYGRPVDANLKR
jgi:RHS repeat-associated protein